MIQVALLIKVLALVCWFLAAIGIPVPKLNLIAAGLFLWFLTSIVVV